MFNDIPTITHYFLLFQLLYPTVVSFGSILCGVANLIEYFFHYGCTLKLPFIIFSQNLLVNQLRTYLGNNGIEVI